MSKAPTRELRLGRYTFRLWWPPEFWEVGLYHGVWHTTWCFGPLEVNAKHVDTPS